MHRCISCLTAPFQSKSYHIYCLSEKKKNVKPEDPGYPVPFVISRIVTWAGQNILFPFILSWETLAWIGRTYVSAAWGTPCLFHRQALKILPVTQANSKDHNYQQKFLLWPFKNHKQGKREWLTTVTLLIDREPKTWSVTYCVSFSISVDLFHYYSALSDGLFPSPLLRLECLSKMCLCNYCL